MNINLRTTRAALIATAFGVMTTAVPGIANAQQYPPPTSPSTVTSLPARPGSGQVVTPPPATTPLPPVTIDRTVPTDLVPELTIAGKTVMRLRATAGGLTPEERATSLRQRLGPILTLPNLSASDVTIRQERPGQTASIYVRDRLLITVDRNLAKANATSVEGLAMQWARSLQETLPQINIAVRLFDPATGPVTAVPVPVVR